MPQNCPSCGSPVVRVSGEVAVRCSNDDQCNEQQIRRLIYFTGKDGMDIEHMGEKVVTQLVQKGLIRTPSDIYRLTRDQVSQLSGFKEKSIQNLLKSIEHSKEVTLPHFIMALGIKYIGTGTAELLASKTGSIEKLSQMSEQELKEIEGIGDKIAESIVHYFADPLQSGELKSLLSVGIKPKVSQVIQFTDHLFHSKIFVLTGTLELYTRSSAAALIKERGGVVTNSVSKKTDYLLAGSDPGSKFEKARELGIQVLTEKEFIALL